MKRFIPALMAAYAMLAMTVYSQEKAEATAHEGKGLRVHNLFQSNMVVQRDKPIIVWGWADPGDVVTISFAGKQGAATATQDGRWRATLPAMPTTSKPQRMTIAVKEKTVTLDNVLLGDVWVIGGQSNMQHPLSRTEQGSVEIISANFPKIRLLTVPPMISNETKTNFPRRKTGEQPDGDWDVCSPKTVREFSAIGFAFARRIHMASTVPIGAIDASRWGTTVEAWTPRPVLEAINSEVVQIQLADWEKAVAEWDPQKDLESRIASFNRRKAALEKQGKTSNAKPPSDLRPSPKQNQNYPGNCYASFIAPIAGFAAKGAIYHQGYNNSRPDAATFYHQVFPKMIKSWRAAFGDPQMAFGIISLCTDSTPQTLDNYVECMFDLGIYVREAHYKTFLDFYKAGDTNVGFASSYDLRRAWYHPQLKLPAGERIARWALATQYGFEKAVYWKPPMLVKMEVKDDKLLLHMDTAVESVDSQAIAGFAIAGADKTYQPAHAECLVIGKDGRNRPRYDRKIVVLSSPHVPKPIHFRYGWGRNPMGNLRAEGVQAKDVPFATQRSDDWAFWDVPHLKPPADKETSREFREEIRKVLQFIDLERRLKDAQRTLDTDRKKYDELKKNYYDENR